MRYTCHSIQSKWRYSGDCDGHSGRVLPRCVTTKATASEVWKGSDGQELTQCVNFLPKVAHNPQSNAIPPAIITIWVYKAAIMTGQFSWWVLFKIPHYGDFVSVIRIVYFATIFPFDVSLPQLLFGQHMPRATPTGILNVSIGYSWPPCRCLWVWLDEWQLVRKILFLTVSTSQVMNAIWNGKWLLWDWLWKKMRIKVGIRRALYGTILIYLI